MVLIDAYPAGEYFFQNVGVDDYSGGYQIGSASYLLVLLPVLIVYIFCQKWIMNGVVAGAVKKENKNRISRGQTENEEELVERKHCISNLSKKLQ